MTRPVPPLRLDSPHAIPQLLFAEMNDGVVVVDVSGVIVDCNPAFHRRLGYEKEELLGRSVLDLDTAEFAALVPERTKEVMARGLATFESAYQSKDGSVLPVEVSARLCQVDGGIVFFGVVRDITERKRFEARLKEGLELYEAAISTPGLGFWAVGAGGRLMEVNDAYVRQSGYRRDELLTMSVPDLEALESAADTTAHLEQIRRDGFARFRTAHRRKDGTVWPVEVVTTYAEVRGGRYFAFFEDITEKVDQENRLELAARVFETMDQAVVVTDADNRIVSINPATSRITGYLPEEVIGQDPKIFASGRHGADFYRELWESLLRTDHWEGEIWDRRKDGGVYLKWLTINAIRNPRGEVVHYVSVFSDITERKRTEELIWRQANFDSLTGLANRIHFHNQLHQQLEQCRRSAKSLALMYLDLDGFKDVNDTLGHAAGDQLLVEVARRLEERARRSDTVARLGGDEFTLLIGDFEQPARVGSLAEQILEVLHQPFHIAERQIHIGASIGIALYPEDGATVEEISKHADLAMYQSKGSGRNTFRFFRPEMNASANHRLALIHDLHRAVRENAFELHYQPKFRIADGRMIGMEALIRWPREGEAPISPAHFIPCAEETGLILPIGKWVLTEACRRTAGWNRRFGADLRVAVNLSARQLRDARIVDEIMTILGETGVAPGQLELEITESMLMADVEQAIAVMKALRGHGISIAIDDFGTGYSSLNYLKRFPITTLKIDQSFIRELTEDSDDAAIVRAVIALGQSLELDVVAEGVESAGQLDFLLRHHCHAAQGYHLARPLPAERFEALLGAN
ncbi:sensor domain-containing protein [Endothiovibrio diazotrophicus]